MAKENFLRELKQPPVYVSLVLLALLGVATLTIRQPFYLNILVLILFMPPPVPRGIWWEVMPASFLLATRPSSA